MKTIFMLIGESGSGKSTLFNDLAATMPEVATVDADKRKGEWDALDKMVDAAIDTGKQVVLSVSRGVTTYMKRRTDLRFRLFFINASIEQIIQNRTARAAARNSTREINVDRIKARHRRLEAIFKKYGSDGVSGDYVTVCNAVKIAASSKAL